MYTEEIAELYDLEHAGLADDLHMYLSYARLTGGPILELGCGTGRLSVPMAEAGYEVVGVDGSPAMIARARLRADRAGVSCEWVEAELQSLDDLSDESFGLVFCALNTWAHIHNPTEARAVLAEVHRVMHPAGLLIIDVDDPAERSSGRGEMVLSAVFKDGEATVLKVVSAERAPREGVERVTIMWDRVAHGTPRRVIAAATMRWYTRLEMELLLISTGFRVREVAGSWDLTPYAGTGDRLILVAERA